MKLKETDIYQKDLYHIIKLYEYPHRAVYIILRIIFEVKIFVKSFTTVSEAKEYINNL